ncbi:MAG: hypothetical protein MUC50_03715 [Myxococcota bacterium]|jgi:hypothetical protein|nr:hypothetical protein [Myxococcota bacterium]
MVKDPSDIVAQARRLFEAGDFAQASRVLEEASFQKKPGEPPLSKEALALAESERMRRSMGLDPVAIAAFLFTAVMLAVLLLIYAQ